MQKKNSGRLVSANNYENRKSRLVFICKNNHKWETSAAAASAGRWCPYCANKKVAKEKTLGSVNPNLAKEWHPIKNGNLTPFDVTPRSGKRIWWKCQLGHEYQQNPDKRSIGVGCPNCGAQTSISESRLFAEIKYCFRQAKHRFRLNGIECDIWIPEHKVAIEFDGWYYHKGREKQDLKKGNKLKEQGIRLIRLREEPLTKIKKNDILVKRNRSIDKKIIIELLGVIINVAKLKPDQKKKIEDYKLGLGFTNEKLFRQMMVRKHLNGSKESLWHKNRKLAGEWNKEKNLNLTPKNVLFMSNKYVWWKCKKSHEWQAKISNRSNGNACPFCNGDRVDESNNLQKLNPNIAREWHPNKNGDLKPNSVRIGSHKRVWWKCKKGHEWEAAIKKRTI